MEKERTVRKAKRKMMSMTMRLRIGNSPTSARDSVVKRTAGRMEEEHWGFVVMMKMKGRLLLGHSRTWVGSSQCRLKLQV